MRGKKGVPHTDPADPPRRRANKVRGHGTWENDRPPVLGIVGRESGQIHLHVVWHSTRAELEPRVLEHTLPNTTIYTDEWGAYHHLKENQRRHATVNHAIHEWARDDDGDGHREVHNNTTEGIWTGLRNFLRTFRGVNKIYLQQYVAIYAWAYRTKVVTVEFLRALLGVVTPGTT